MLGDPETSPDAERPDPVADDAITAELGLHAGANVVDMLLAAAPVGFAFYDPQLRYIRVNEVLARADQIPAAEHIGRRPTELLGEFGALIEERVARTLSTGEAIVNEDVTVGQGGAARYWNTSWYPAFHPDGSIAGIAVVALDVTDRRVAEQLLRRSEARYRSLVQASAMDVWRADPEGYQLVDLPAWREITGQEAPDVLGVGWLAGVHPEDRTRAWDSWAESVQTQTPYICEFRIGTEGNGWRTLVARGLPIIEDGQVVEWVGTTLDVTEFREAEQARSEAYSRVQDAALTLQRSMLPEHTLQPEEVDVCSRYVPGVEETEVGGDWYDVIELGAGRIGLVIGDVMGRGIRAAAVMGQLRTAVRAYSRLELPPAELLSMLDGLVAELADEQIVTCVYAVYDPGSQVLSIANAGHLPPVLVRPGIGATLLDGSVGPPLGVGEEVFVEEQVKLAPGNLLALYTDGLVESRERDIDVGIGQLTDVLVAGSGSLDSRCDDVLEQLGRRSGLGDDVALLLVQLPPESDRRMPAARMHVPRGIQSVAQTRTFCDRIFADWELAPEIASAALLVVNELVTNALVHGRAPLELLLRRSRTRLYVEVVDGSGHLPRRRLAGYEDEGGRGLLLVAALSERWGVRPAGDGKAVWAAIVLPTNERA